MTPRHKGRRPGTLRLAEDSLAYTFHEAALLVAAVLDGKNLTEAFDRRLHERPDWSDAVRGAVRDHAWSTLRDFGRGTPVLRKFLSKPLPLQVEAVLLVGLNRLEARPGQSYTIVDQAVEAVSAIAPGLSGVANGVLRNRIRQGAMVDALLEHDAVARYRHPDWWIKRVRGQYPDTWAEILAEGSRRPPMSVRVNRRRASVESVEAGFAESGIEVRRLENDALLLARPLPVSKLPGFAEGRLSVQDAGAQWAAQWLAPEPGQRVLDACAAPGGKAAHLLESADIELTALELEPHRSARIGENFSRLGLNGHLLVGDARDPDAWWDGVPFERILADVPCSASGVVRRHPDIKWLRRDEDIAGFAARQREILDALWHTLAPGGKMLYVTCSVFAEENEEQLAAFCRRQGTAERIALDGRLERQLLPTAEHDGFYYALVQKRG